MKIIKYPDGSSYVEVPKNSFSKNTFRINTYEDLWHLNQFVDAFNNIHGERPTITIPCLIDAQADRRFKSNQSSGLKLVCNFLNGMNAEFKVFHPHNPEVVEALMNNVEIIDNSEFIYNVLNNITLDNWSKGDKGKMFNTILMSSDAGGFKPLIKLCDKISWEGETYSASKSRDPENGKLTQFVGKNDFQGKDVLIVDDICVYGGTFKGLSKILKTCNIGKLYLAVSHMTVQDLGEAPVTNYFDKVFTTNSKYDKYTTSDVYERHPSNLEVINLF